jgi:hypothetical protein
MSVAGLVSADDYISTNIGTFLGSRGRWLCSSVAERALKWLISIGTTISASCRRRRVKLATLPGQCASP